MFVLAQLSDPHIGAEWADADPIAGFAAVVDAVRALPQPPDAVVVSGDLADHAAAAEYDHVRDVLATIDAPSYVLPGNHDDVAALHRHFGATVPYAVDLGALQLVALDTKRPGEDAGSLDHDRLAWLDRELAAAPAQPTLIAMHHPPLVTGVFGIDHIGLPPADIAALGDVIRRHPQVRRLAAGHIHCVVTGELDGRPVISAPSTYIQARANFESGAIELVPEPRGFVLHTVADGEIVSHFQAA